MSSDAFECAMDSNNVSSIGNNPDPDSFEPVASECAMDSNDVSSISNNSDPDSFEQATSNSLHLPLDNSPTPNLFPSDSQSCDQDGASIVDDFKVSDSLFQPLYEGARITICGTYCAIMEFKRDCKLPFTAIDKLLQLLQLLCPSGSSLPRSVHVLKSFFQKYTQEPRKQRFCPECRNELLPNEDRCMRDSCQGQHPDYLYTMTPERRICHIISSKKIYMVLCPACLFLVVALGNYKYMSYSSKTTSQFIYDIHAGSGYSHLQGQSNVLGTFFNTDGVQPFKSSNIAVWPIYLAFSNLPPSMRMNRDNIAIVAIWVGSKPPMNVLFRPLKETVKRLSTFPVLLPDGTKSYSLVLLFGTFDLIAKAPAMNMMQHNGVNGCSVCLHPGQSFQRRRVYLPGLVYTNRNHEMYLNDAKDAERNETVVNGVKGKTLLSSMVDLCDGTPIDYMHCVLEGVTKRILEVWVKCTSSPAYIGRSIAQVDMIF